MDRSNKRVPGELISPGCIATGDKKPPTQVIALTVDRRRKKSKTYKFIAQLTRSKDRYFEVLAACAEMRDADGSFSLSEEAVEQLAARCRMKAWEIEYCIRKHDDTFQEIQAPSFLAEQKLRTFAEPRAAGKVFMRNDHRGCLAPHIHLALREAGL